jgi:hypothetical protein
MTSQPIAPQVSPVAMPAPQTAPAAADIDPNGLLLIVVGAHLRAEFTDRPLAYRLREQVLRWQDQSLGEDDAKPLRPVVCSDVWYLNSTELAARPTVCIGDPNVNAASAMLATRMPTAFVIENTLRVHLDLEFIDLRACMWGANHSATASAVDVFVERYLDGFLRAAHG